MEGVTAAVTAEARVAGMEAAMGAEGMAVAKEEAVKAEVMAEVAREAVMEVVAMVQRLPPQKCLQPQNIAPLHPALLRPQTSHSSEGSDRFPLH